MAQCTGSATLVGRPEKLIAVESVRASGQSIGEDAVPMVFWFTLKVQTPGVMCRDPFRPGCCGVVSCTALREANLSTRSPHPWRASRLLLRNVEAGYTPVE